MALRKIVVQGEECLTKVCRPVTEFNPHLVPDVVYRYVVNGASITKSRQTPKKQQDKYLAHKAFVAYVDARGIRLDARFRRITRRSFGRWGLTWLKIKECGDRETYRLFDLIPVWRKRVTDKQACDGH